TSHRRPASTDVGSDPPAVSLPPTGVEVYPTWWE
ncbi:hypothetical protein AVEN_219540-1, partial [Araneus ventricosus]